MLQDIRYGIRTMLQNKGWTAVVLLSLALGIGANTALFSLIDAAFLKKLPVKNPHELVLFDWTSGSKWPAASIVNSARRDPVTNSVSSWSFSYDTYQKFRIGSETLSGLLAFCQILGNLDIDGYAESATGQLVSGNYFGELGVSAILGRTIADHDDKPTAEPVIVISHRYWQRRFSSDPNIIGRKIRLFGSSTTIVGVTAAGFDGTLGFGRSADFSLPLSRAPRNYLDQPATWWVMMMGRTKSGVDAQQVQAELERVFQASALETYDAFVKGLPAGSPSRANYPSAPDTPHLRVASGSQGLTKSVEDASRLFFTLIAIFAFLLLLVCLNVANLLVARSAARHQEIGVRLAMGASRIRVIRQLLTESSLMAACAGLLGVVCAHWGKDLLAAFLPQNQFSVVTLEIDYRVLSFTALVSLITGILFGFAPALHVRDSQLHSTFKETGRGLRGPRTRISRSLVVIQVSVLIVLLVGAGLFLGTLRNLRDVDVGFSTKSLLISPTVVLRIAGYDNARIVQLHDRLIERVRGVPGVISATTSYLPPVRTNANVRGTRRVNDSGLTTYNGWVYEEVVGPDYFKTLGVPIARGRDFGPTDHSTAAKVAIINETLARQSFPNTDPIGQHFRGMSREDIQIIGVIKDVKHEIRGNAPTLYQLIAQNGPPFAAYFNIRTAVAPTTLAPALLEAIRGVEPNVAISEVKALDTTIEEGLAQEWILARASGFFAMAALLLAAIGLFGVMSFSVTRRTGEIGIRIALGARRVDIAWLVLREVLLLTLIGVFGGLIASLAMTRLITSLLFGLDPADPVAMSSAVVLMLAVAIVAGYLPARRASRVNPLIALRHE